MLNFKCKNDATVADGMKIAIIRSRTLYQECEMSSSPEVLLSCVHLYSLLGERTRSRECDRQFVERMRNSLETSQLDNNSPSEIE